MSSGKFNNVRDSSIWKNPSAFALAAPEYNSIYQGTVISVLTRGRTVLYDCELLCPAGLPILAKCETIQNSNGVYNYEEIIHNGCPNYNDKSANIPATLLKPGDSVIVAFINGNINKGIILGGIKHELKSIDKLKIQDGPQKYSIFNGIEQLINKDGEFELTFKGQPSNLSDLQAFAGGGTAPTPVYDEKIGGTHIKIDKTGSIILSDKNTEEQKIKIDKTNNRIEIMSGNDAAIKLSSVKKGISIKANKIAIGKNGIELLDQISQFIEALGQLSIQSPVGPCAPVSASTDWPKVLEIKTKIDQIKGQLE